MRGLGFYPVLIIFSAPISLAAKCAAPPLRLPYVNTSVVPGTLTQGISLSIGTPWQHVALTPSLQLDNTFIPRYSNSCIHTGGMPMPSNGTEKRTDLRGRDGHPGSFEENPGGLQTAWTNVDWKLKCAETYGGGFNPALSSTFKDTGTNDQLNEFWFRKEGFKDWHFVNEAFAFADYVSSHVSATDAVPENDGNGTANVIIPDAGALFGGMGSAVLGLGPNSTLIDLLAEESVAPSKSWSLTSQELCLGCIDDSASSAPFQSFKPTARDKDLPCVLQAKVEALNWHPKADIEGATLIKKSFTACIDPGVRFLVLPGDARTVFKKLTEMDIAGEYDDYMVFKGPAGADEGILTIRLEGALEVNVTMPGAGKAVDTEDDPWRVPIGKGGWGAYGNDVWVLGKPFTDRVVLKWDANAQEYGIANANEDPGREADIKPLGCDAFPKHSGQRSGVYSMGVLIGSVVGGFVGGLVFAIAGLWFFKKGQKGVKSKYQPIDEDKDMAPMARIPTDRRTLDSFMSPALSPPPASVRDSLRSQIRPISPMMEPQLVADNSIYEAPEGGTSNSSKGGQVVTRGPGVYQR